MIGAAPPFSLNAPAFRFRALAMLAGRAPLGGEREMALAAFMAARLAEGTLAPTGGLSAVARRTRGVGARLWFSTLTLPAATRIPLARLVEATEGDDLAVAEALVSFAEIAKPVLDAASRAEIADLVTALGTS